MKISVIGTGYVGLVSGVCYADAGNEVVCVDKVQEKIEMLNSGVVPIYEPGLKELIDKNMELGRLKFTTDIEQSVKDSDIIIIAVGTPSLPDGRANLDFVKNVANEIGVSINGYKIIVTKSTVPVGTNEIVESIISAQTDVVFDVASVPEFLREGSAIQDTLNSNRVVIGTNSKYAADVLSELHKPFTRNILVTDIRSSEMIKYASNAFLATKISFINEIANICEKVGADVTQVALGMGYDHRIGNSFLNPGIGYGGSCFPKDTQALIQIAGQMNYDFKLLKSVVEVNNDQRFNVLTKLKLILNDLENKTVGIWGLAFKPNTDDVRDTPAYEIIKSILDCGGKVKAYDPLAIENFKKTFRLSHNIIYCDTAKDVALDSDALCILTEWEEFSLINPTTIQKWLKRPNLIDGRNIYNEVQLYGTDLTYYSVGRPSLNKGVKDKSPVLFV